MLNVKGQRLLVGKVINLVTTSVHLFKSIRKPLCENSSKGNIIHGMQNK